MRMASGFGVVGATVMSTGADGTSATAWNKSVAAYRADRDAMIDLVNDRKVDLFASVPSSKKHTLLREVLLLADHTASHLREASWQSPDIGEPRQTVTIRKPCM